MWSEKGGPGFTVEGELESVVVGVVLHDRDKRGLKEEEWISKLGERVEEASKPRAMVPLL